MRAFPLAALLLLLAACPSLGAMEFIPDTCDAVAAIRPAAALDPALVPDPALRARLERILEEAARATGFDLRKDADFAGFLLTRAEGFLAGERPRGAAFAAGRIDPAAVVKAAGAASPQKVAEFDLYPVGDGAVFGFVGREAVLLGGVDEVAASLMAARKPAMSGAERFKAFAGRLAAPGAVFAASLRVSERSAAALRKLAGDEWKPEALLAGLESVELWAGKEGAAFTFTGGSDAYVVAARPVVEAVIAKGAADAAAELARAKALPASDPARADAEAGAAFAHAALSAAKVSVEGRTLAVHVPPEALAGAGGRFLAELLRVFASNWAVGRDDDGTRACLATMRVLEGATDLALLERKVAADKLSPEALAKAGLLAKPPVCPKGGTYAVRAGKNGPEVECSVHGSMDAIYDRLYNPAKTK